MTERYPSLSDLLKECTDTAIRLRTRCDRYEAALTLIAAPVRADGTYNRCREACEQLARAALGEDP